MLSRIKTLVPEIKLQYKPNKHIPALDGLRGVAVLSVMLYHCFPFLITKWGWMGVDLFFVLSGFLITGILVDSKSSKGYYKNFIVRRVLRIFPLYYFVLLFMLIIIPAINIQFLGPDYYYYTHHATWFWLYFQNWLFSKDGFPHNHIMVHFWSLAVEEQFYLLWPLIVKIFSKKTLKIVCFLLIFLSIWFRLDIGYSLGFTYTYPYLATLSRMDALLIGALTSLSIRDHRALLEKITIFAGIFAIIGTVGGIIILKSLNFFILPPIYTFIDLLFACILILSLAEKGVLFIKRFVDQRWLKFLGKYSYGLYVYHYIIFECIAMHWFKIRDGAPQGAILPLLICGLITIILSILISWLSYHLLETPFLKLKKFFTADKKNIRIPQFR